MYYPPLFTSVPRSFDPRGPSSLGGPVVDVPLVGHNHTRENNPLDLTVKPLPHTPTEATATSISDHSSNDPSELMMLDHRKLASLAASHSLSAMGRQLGPGGSTATMLDPTLYRLAYGPEALVPPPFCYDRATGVAVPTSLAGHQLMASFLQQQQRDRCLEQQQALFAARTTAAQQAAVAAAAAAFMDPATLPFNLRTAMTQREAAAALAATRALYPPTMPTPMVLPAFSLYTDDKGAFTSLRNGGAPTEKAYINGNTALEAARFAEHLQRIREQHLQQAAKCSNSCCSSMTGLGPTVQCACCIQSPSQAALCARSPIGCSVKDPTTAATANKVCNSNCDFLQPGLTFLHRPTVTTSGNTVNGDLRLPTAVAPSSYCATTTTNSTYINSDAVSSTSASHVFQPATSWGTGLPPVSNTNKTAFSVPKKKEGFKEVINPVTKDPKLSKDFDGDRLYHHHTVERNIFNIKKEKSDPVSDGMYIKEEIVPVPQYRREHDVKSLLTPRTVISNLSTAPKISATANHGVAHTILTTVTPTVPTKCEGGTIMAKTTKLPPVLEPFRPVDTPSVISERYPVIEVSNSISSPQGPPPLIAAPNGHQPPTTTGGKDRHAFTMDALRHQSLLHSGIPSSPYKNYEKIPDVHQKLPKKTTTTTSTKSNGLPTYVKEEPILPSKSHSSSTLPKPIPHLPPAPPPHLPPTHYASHYRPYNHLQNTASWLPPAHPNVTVAPPPPKTSSGTLPSSTSTASMPKVAEASMKREPDHVSSASNVLQSLLVRPGGGIGLPPPMPGAYPILEYQYHHQHHSSSHGLNVAQGGVGPSVAESLSPAAASVAPPLEKAEIKVEGSGGSDAVVPTAVKYPKKRHSATPTKFELMSAVPEKKRTMASEFAPVSGYAFQYPTFTTDVKESPGCPYTFVPEPPGYYETKALVPSELRPQKSSISIIQPLESKPSIVKSDTNVYSPGASGNCEEIFTHYYGHPVLCSTTEFHIKNEKRAAAARARSKLRKRVLARIYRKPRPLLCPDNTILQKLSTSPGNRLSAPDATTGPLPDDSVPNTIPPPANSNWRNGRLLFKIAKRRRIRSGLDMALKKNKKKSKRLVYKIESEMLMRPSRDTSHKSNDGSGGMPIPAEMKKLMVNKALGETVLHRAARLGYPEVVAYCLETNCGTVNTPDNAGYTPLHECCSRGHLEIARALLQYGADVNASAAGGIRPLHDAVENDHIEVVRLLLSFGADPSITTYSGLTPLKLAHSPLMAEFLQGFMADISGEIEHRPHPAWRFWGSASCLDPQDNGYDVFDGVPSDNEAEVEGEGDDFLFEVSDSPHLPTFRLTLPSSSTKAQYNFLRLSDVLRKMSIKRDYFFEHYSHIEVLTVPKHEFEASATCSQLLTGSKLDTCFTNVSGHKMDFDLTCGNGHTVDLVRLDNPIRKVLGIETISVR